MFNWCTELSFKAGIPSIKMSADLKATCSFISDHLRVVQHTHAPVTSRVSPVYWWAMSWWMPTPTQQLFVIDCWKRRLQHVSREAGREWTLNWFQNKNNISRWRTWRILHRSIAVLKCFVDQVNDSPKYTFDHTTHPWNSFVSTHCQQDILIYF